MAFGKPPACQLVPFTQSLNLFCCQATPAVVYTDPTIKHGPESSWRHLPRLLFLPSLEFLLLQSLLVLTLLLAWGECGQSHVCTNAHAASLFFCLYCKAPVPHWKSITHVVVFFAFRHVTHTWPTSQLREHLCWVFRLNWHASTQQWKRHELS